MASSEAKLMRTCAPLYGSMAIEGVSAVLMCFLFLYLWMKVCTRADIKSPLRAVCRLTRFAISNSARDLWVNVVRWPDMAASTLEERYLFCRKVNQAILLQQAFNAFISTTRWLHIGNVNGFRYLGYAITCPPMQAELVLLIAPIVPCYRFVAPLTYVLTVCMLLCGWAGSIIDAPLLSCTFYELIQWDDVCFEEFSMKFKVISVAVLALCFLCFVQIPCLGLLYWFKGGSTNMLLPPGYVKLLAIVVFTWLGFPVWWFLSYEGMSVITDTKINAVGFALLNLLSKASYTLHVIESVNQHLARKAEQAKQNGIEPVPQPVRPRSNSTCSIDSDVPSETRAALTVTAWLLRFLRNFDDNSELGADESTNVADSVPCTITATTETESEGEPESRGTSKSSGGPKNDSKRDDSAANLWEGVEPMYRRFMRDAGVTPACFAAMSAKEKVSMREKFDKVASMLIGKHSKHKEWTTPSIPHWIDESAGLLGVTDDQLRTEVERLNKEIFRRLAITAESRARPAPSALSNDHEDDQGDSLYAKSPRREQCDLNAPAVDARREFRI